MAGHLGDGIESSLPSRNFAWVAMQTTASFKITVCGIEELPQHCEARVSHVVSILDPTWPVPSALHTHREQYREEPALVLRNKRSSWIASAVLTRPALFRYAILMLSAVFPSRSFGRASPYCENK